MAFKLIQQISIPEAGLFLGKSPEGVIYRKVPDVKRMDGGYWEVYDRDVITLALEGNTTELNALRELSGRELSDG